MCGTHMHRCGRYCRQTPIEVRGSMVCPLSFRVLGPRVSTKLHDAKETGDDDAPVKRRRVVQTDPGLDKREAERRQLAADVALRLLGEEHEPAAALALEFAAAMPESVDFRAVMCAVLYHSVRGLRHDGQVLVPRDERVAERLPDPKTFPQRGVPSGLLHKGASAVQRHMRELQRVVLLPRRQQLGTACLPLHSRCRRLRTQNAAGV